MIYRYHCTETKNLESIQESGLHGAGIITGSLDPESKQGKTVFLADSIRGALVLSRAELALRHSTQVIAPCLYVCRHYGRMPKEFHCSEDWTVIEFQFPDGYAFEYEGKASTGGPRFYECTVPAPLYLTGKERILRYYFEVTPPRIGDPQKAL